MRAKIKKLIFRLLMISIISIIVFACNNNDYKENVSVEASDISAEYQSIDKTEINNNNVANELKIIKSANVRYKVENVQTATNSIKDIANNHNAYISDLRYKDNLYVKENRFTIKVPANNFNEILDSISKVAEFIEFENITTQDITEEYLDIESRLKTKREVKARFETILRENAKNVEDILATEDRIRILQEEIESIQGRYKYLTNRVAYSTIQVDLYQNVDYIAQPNAFTKSFWIKTKEAFSFGWDLLEGIILGIIHIWPLLIVITIAIVLFRKKIIRK